MFYLDGKVKFIRHIGIKNIPVVSRLAGWFPANHIATLWQQLIICDGDGQMGPSVARLGSRYLDKVSWEVVQLRLGVQLN